MSKNYVVVGGSKGMGLGIVRRLAENPDTSVMVFSRTPGELDSMENVQHRLWDASTDDFPVNALPEAIHGLAYCPGTLNLKSLKGLKPEVFRSDFEVNVVGATKAIQACLGGLKAAGSASVLLFSTVAVGQGMYAHASIAASKGAVEGLTRTLAAELSPEVRVNCIAPALTHTSLTERFFANAEKAASLGEKYPLGRAGNVDDIAAMGDFLLGNQSSWITGQVIGVDGGMSTVRK